jgi:beta-phosphoglucomutase-like phosphatase (HAD superfamily)
MNVAADDATPAARIAKLRVGRGKLRLVIFDCDGVLINSEGVCNRVVAQELGERGWPMTAEEAEQRFIGMSFPDMVPMIEHRLGRPLAPDWPKHMADRVTRVMAAEAEAMPGALAAVSAAETLGLDWQVASNSSRREMEAKFARTGLGLRVRGRLHGIDDVMADGGRGKPEPDLYLRASRSAGVDPGACLVVEDSVLGARAAAAAGMSCLGFRAHGEPGPLAREGAVVFRTLFDLPMLLRAATEAGG